MELSSKEKAFDQLLKNDQQIDDHIKLKLITHQMGKELLKLVDDNREVFVATMGWVSTFLTEEDSFKFVQAWSQEYLKRKKLCFFIEESGTNEAAIAGFVCFRTVDLESGEAEIGYMMDQRWCGKGILRKCLQLLLDIGFEGMGLQKVTLVTATDNERSINVGKKLGFDILSVEKGQITINGIQKDKVTMQLTKEIFQQKKQ